jgi:hypothetical protein
MARQWWLKGETAGISLNEFFKNVTKDVSFFAEMIVKQSRRNKKLPKKYVEIYRVIDDTSVLKKLRRFEES